MLWALDLGMRAFFPTSRVRQVGSLLHNARDLRAKLIRGRMPLPHSCDSPWAIPVDQAEKLERVKGIEPSFRSLGVQYQHLIFITKVL